MAIQVLNKEEIEVVSGGSASTLLGGLLVLVNDIGHSALGVNLGKLLGGILKSI